MSADPANENLSGPPSPCPTCGKPSVHAHRPFCSKRCRDVDLQRWFSGAYAIPIAADENEPDDELGDDAAGQGGRGLL